MLPILGLVVAMASVQTGAALAKSLFPAVGPEGTTALRLTLAAVLLNAYWRPWRRWPGPRPLRAVVLYGAALGAMNLTFYLSLTRLPLGLSVGIEFLGPLTVALLASHRALDLLWAGLAAAGVALILPWSTGAGAVDPLGLALALGAALFWGLYIVFGQRAAFVVDGGTATALGMTTAALVGAPLGLARAGTALLEPSILGVGLGVALLSSVVPYSLEMAALKRLRRQTFSILMSVEPALAALSGWLFLGEALTPRQRAAVACIVAASAGSAWLGRGAAAVPEA